MARSKKSPVPVTTDLRTAMSDPMVMSAFSLLMLSFTRSYPEVLHPDFLARKDDFSAFFGSLLRVHYFLTHETIDPETAKPLD